MNNQRFAALAAATIGEQQRCRALALTCRFIDLRATPANELRAGLPIVLPVFDRSLAFANDVAARLQALRRAHAVVFSVEGARRFARSSTGGITDAALLITPDGSSGILDVLNAGTAPRRIPATEIHVGMHTYAVGPLLIAAGEARDVRIPLTGHTISSTILAAPAPHSDDLPITATAYVRAPQNRNDAYRDGLPTFVLDNERVRVIVSADAGARVFVFEDLATGRNAATTIGLLRDDVATPPTPSPRDYISAYTHPMRTGTFNRAYDCHDESNATRLAVLCTYDAPDLAAQPVHFEKEFFLEPNATSFQVRLRCSVDAVSVNGTGVTSYAGGKDEWLTFPLQGPPSVSANGGRSP
jgi:hypothetical protein